MPGTGDDFRRAKPPCRQDRRLFMRTHRCFLLLLFLLALAGAPLHAADTDKKAFPKNEEFKRVNDKIKEVAGTAEFLRSVPKHFATLQAVDLRRRRVTLLIEGEKLPKVWPVSADAEIKVAGWWG